MAQALFYARVGSLPENTTKLAVVGKTAFRCIALPGGGGAQDVVFVPLDTEKDTNVLFYYVFRKTASGLQEVGGASLQTIHAAGGCDLLKGDSLTSFGRPARQSVRIIPCKVLHLDAIPPRASGANSLADSTSVGFQYSRSIRTVQVAFEEEKDLAHEHVVAALRESLWWQHVDLEFVTDVLDATDRDHPDAGWLHGAIEHRMHMLFAKRHVDLAEMVMKQDATDAWKWSVATVCCALCLGSFCTDPVVLDQWISAELAYATAMWRSPAISADDIAQVWHPMTPGKTHHTVEMDPVDGWTCVSACMAGGDGEAVRPCGRSKFLVSDMALRRYVMSHFLKKALMSLSGVGGGIGGTFDVAAKAAIRRVLHMAKTDCDYVLYMTVHLQGMARDSRDPKMLLDIASKSASSSTRPAMRKRQHQASTQRPRTGPRLDDIEEVHRLSRAAPCMWAMTERARRGEGHMSFQERSAWIALHRTLGTTEDAVRQTMRELFVDRGNMDIDHWTRKAYSEEIKDIFARGLMSFNCETMRRRGMCAMEGNGLIELEVMAPAALQASADPTPGVRCASVSAALNGRTFTTGEVWSPLYLTRLARGSAPPSSSPATNTSAPSAPNPSSSSSSSENSKSSSLYRSTSCSSPSPFPPTIACTTKSSSSPTPVSSSHRSSIVTSGRDASGRFFVRTVLLTRLASAIIRSLSSNTDGLLAP